MNIRIVPMSEKGGFENKEISKIQKEFFIDTLKKGKNNYRYLTRINADKDDLLLFQFNSSIIASATFESIVEYPVPSKDGYRGEYIFKNDTIKVFKPITAEELKKIFPKFTKFSNTKQFLDVSNYNDLIERIVNYDLSFRTSINVEDDYDYNETRIKTKDEWIKVLNNEEKNNNDTAIQILRTIFFSTEHKCSCKKISDIFAKDVCAINSIISAFGKRALEELNLPEKVRRNGLNIRWNIPFIKNEIDDDSEWQLRPELVSALEEKYDLKAIKNEVENYELDDETSLKKFNKYSRKDIHDIFGPDTPFSPGSGIWGGSGIIKIPNTEKDYIFLVTYGSHVSTHVFEENIDEHGIITWQSQANQRLTEKRIQDFINHDDLKSNIYLFLRTSSKDDYYYLGKLSYIEHDKERECPVYFRWQIKDWDGENDNKRLGIKTDNNTKEIDIDKLSLKDFKLTKFQGKIDFFKKERKGTTTKEFTNRNVDFEGEAKKNSKLGKKGEDFVVDLEKEFLIKNGRTDLAEKVKATREFAGNAEKFDVISYELDGTPKYIEVKTTTGNMDNAFYISEQEVAFSEAIEFSKNYYLYRVYNFDKEKFTANYAIIKGPINRAVLDSTNYICRIGETQE